MYEYKFNKNKCWYKNVCEKIKNNSCNSSCVRYMEMDYLLWASNLPLKQQYPNSLSCAKIDKESFKILSNIRNNITKFVDYGEDLYLYSTITGNGKTTWAIKILLKYFDDVWSGNGFNCRGVFVHVPTFLTKLKETISKKDEYFTQLKENIKTTDLVIWDDIAASKLSNYDYTTLLSYVDNRKLSQLSNIFTGNLLENDLKESVGARLKSRIWNGAVNVKLSGPDRRATKW